MFIIDVCVTTFAVVIRSKILVKGLTGILTFRDDVNL